MQETVPYAIVWRRSAAFLIDMILLLAIVTSLFYFFFGFDLTIEARLNDPDDIDARIQFLIERNLIRDLTLLIWIFYSIVADASPIQGTLGKRVCRIKVVDEAGDRLTILKSIARNLSKIVSVVPLGLGFLWAFFSKQKQTWHDKIAKTYVVDCSTSDIRNVALADSSG